MNEPTHIIEIDDSTEGLETLRRNYERLFMEMALNEHLFIDSARVAAMAVLTETLNHLDQHVLIIKDTDGTPQEPTNHQPWEEVPYWKK
jgi:hypothetical protein